MEVVDNQFMLWLLRIGVIGTGIIMYIYLKIFRSAFQNAKIRHHKIGVVAFWVSIFFFLNAGAFLENIRLFFLFILFVTSIHFQIKRKTAEPAHT